MSAVQAGFSQRPKTDRRVTQGGLSRLWRATAVVMGFCLMLSACVSVPSQEMSDARRALDSAEQAGARTVLPDAMGRASAALDSASRALRAGQYDDARGLARAARDEAIAARMLATRLQQIKAAIAAARTEGRAWQDAEQLLQRALQMSRAGDSDGALSVADKAAISLR